MTLNPTLYSEAFLAAHELLTPDPEDPMAKGKPYNAYSIAFDPELLERVNLFVPANAGQFVTMHARADQRIEATNEVKEPIPAMILLEGDRIAGDTSQLTTHTYHLYEKSRMNRVIDHATDPNPNPFEDHKDKVRSLNLDENKFATAALIATVKHFRPLDS